MKYNKGIGVIGIILIIVGVFVVSGGAYYLGTKNPKPEDDWKGMQENLKKQVNNLDDSSKIEKDDSNWKTYTSPNKFSFKYDSSNAELGEEKENSVSFVDNFGRATGFSVEYLDGSITPILDDICKNIKTSEINVEGKVFTVCYSKAEPFGTFIYTNGSKIIIIGDMGLNNLIDLGSVTILNSEESIDEVFKHQPGIIKSIEYDGAEFLVDLLTRNPEWTPGDDTPFFLNQNPKIRRLNVNNATIVKNCGSQMPDYYSAFENNLRSFTNHVQDIFKRKETGELQKDFEYTAYFDIEGVNITTIYEQCLP